jgi:hypothetical protein
MICAALVANPQFRPPSTGDAPATSPARVSSSVPLRRTLNFSFGSVSLRKALTVFSIDYELFCFSLFLSSKRARVYFQLFTNSFTFRAKRACFCFQAFTNSFFAQKTPLLFLFINLRTLFCKMPFFLKGVKLIATNQ